MSPFAAGAGIPVAAVLLMAWTGVAGPARAAIQDPASQSPPAAPADDGAAPPPATAATAPSSPAEWERILVAPESHANERANAAIELLRGDLAQVVALLTPSARDDVVVALLEAVRIRAGTRPDLSSLVPQLLACGALSDRDAVRKAAEKALVELFRVAPDATRDLLLAGLSSEDPKRVEAAARALGLSRDLAAAPALIELLRAVNGNGQLARAAAEALATILPLEYGADADRWEAFLVAHAGMSRDRILEELLDEARAAAATELQQKDAEIIRLTMELHGADAAMLVKDLSHALPEVRRFAAETLARHVADWEVAAARDVLLARIEDRAPETRNPPAVEAAFLRLLLAIETAKGDPPADPRRDAAIAAALRSGEPAVVVAAAAFAGRLGTPAVTEAVAATLDGLALQPLDAEARTALVNAAGQAKLEGARDVLIRILRFDESVDARVAAAINLGKLGAAVALDDLARALEKDPDWRVRRNAAIALAGATNPAVVDRLVAALGDEKPEVRSQVALALSAFPESTDGRIVQALLARLKEETVVRTDLVRALGRRGSELAVPALCAEISASANGVNGHVPANGANGDTVPAAASDVELRREARDALSKIAGADPLRWERIVELTRDRDPAVEAWAFGQRAKALTDAGAEPSAVNAAKLGQARALLRAGQWDAVVTVTGEALSNDPKEARRASLLACQGSAFAALGRPAEAIDAFERALRTMRLPENERVEVTFLLARLQVEAGNPGRAEELLKAEADLPLDQLLLLARAERLNRRYAPAAAHLRELLASSEADALVLPARLELFEILLEIEPDSARAEVPVIEALLAGADAGLRQRFERAKARLPEYTPAADREPGGPAGMGAQDDGAEADGGSGAGGGTSAADPVAGGGDAPAKR